VEIIVEERLAPLVEDDDAIVVGDMRRLEEAIIDGVSRGEKVIAVYSNAWSRLPAIRSTLMGKGYNHLLYTPIDPVEFELASPIPSRALLEAKKSFVLSSSLHRAERLVVMHKRVSRRDLLTRPLQAMTVYKPIPLIESSTCLQQPNCNACIGSCPFEALSGKPPRVDPARCTSCGICSASCPFGLIEMPGLRVESLDYMLRGIRRSISGPAYLVFACWESLPALRDISSRHPTVFLGVECPGWVTQQTMLLAMSRGFHVIVYCGEPAVEACGVGGVDGPLSQLEGLPVYPRVIRGAGELSKALEAPPRGDIVLPDNIGRVEALYRLARAYNVSSLELSSPIAGIVEIDASRCPLCEGCSSSCPYGALETRVAGDRISIVFMHDKCQACLLCEDACPYGALRLSFRFNIGLYGRKLTLVEDEVARCKMCGRPIGSKKMILDTEKKLRARNAPQWLIDQLWLCPDCKIRGMSRRVRG